MIINITYPSARIKREIASVVGPSFSFIERIKMGGIGTAKLQIMEATDEIHKLLSHTRDAKYCHLECRKMGLVVGFQSVMKIYVWLIPYHQLSIYNNSGELTVYGKSNSIKLSAPFNGSVDKKFIRKVLALKSTYLEKFNFRP